MRQTGPKQVNAYHWSLKVQTQEGSQVLELYTLDGHRVVTYEDLKTSPAVECLQLTCEVDLVKLEAKLQQDVKFLWKRGIRVLIREGYQQ